MGWDKAIRGYLSVPAPYIHIRGYLLAAHYRKFGIVNHYTEVQMMFTTLVALMIGVIIGYIWRMTWEGGEMKEMAIEQVEDGCDEIIEQEEEDWDRDCPVDIWRREQEELERERIEREKKMAEEKRVTEERSKEEGGAYRCQHLISSILCVHAPCTCVHGTCIRNKCVCNPGYSGDSCDQRFECPGNCSGRGNCLAGMLQIFDSPARQFYVIYHVLLNDLRNVSPN